MSLKFCANLSFLFEEPVGLFERYVTSRKLGFKGVECPNPYVLPVEKVEEFVNSNDFCTVLINVPTGDTRKGELGFAAVEGKEDMFLEGIHSAAKYAKAMNCPQVHIMSGIVPNPSSSTLNRYMQNISSAARILQSENLTALIEPINQQTVPNYFMSSYTTALDVINTLKAPNLKLQLDVFHLQQISGSLTKSITDLLPYIGHIQIAQVPQRHEPNTEGEIDYRYVLNLLQKLQYPGWIGLEYKPKTNVEAGLSWIKEFNYAL